VSRLAATFKFVSWASRPMSRSSRAHASIRSTIARFTAGIAAAALLFAAQAPHRLQRDPSADALHSVSRVATLPVLRAVLSHRLASEQRSTTRWPNGFDSALPASAHVSLVAVAAHNVAATTSGLESAPFIARGYDATAPPALD